MIAAVLEKLGRPPALRDLSIPRLGVGQVLVRVLASGICGKQLAEMDGRCGPDRYLPHLFGHEGGGDVEAIGPGVTTVKPGDRVVMHWRKGLGIEAPPVVYHTVSPTPWTVGAGPVHTLADHAVVSENRVTAVPASISPDICALMGCAVTTAMGIIEREAKLRIGESIAVAGCGGVGLMVMRAAAARLAGDVFAIDRKDKTAFSKQFGASWFILSGEATYPAVDVFVDTTGVPDVIVKGLRSVKRGGRMILVGQPPPGTSLVLEDFRQLYAGKTIMDSQGGSTVPHEDIPRYVGLWSSGAIEFDDLVTHRFPLSSIEEAFKQAATSEGGRIVVDCTA